MSTAPLEGVLALMLVLSAPACSPTYPKEKLGESIRKIFKEEVGTEDVRYKVVGPTLYVSFQVENMVSATLDLPKDVSEKIENAMLSVVRIGMSTDESLDFIVLDARDNTWGVQTTFIRRIEDLKFLYYMKISKMDFDERFILETRRFDPEKEPPERGWNGLTLQEYMARWVAFRIGLGSKSNPFLSVLMGVSKVTPAYDGQTGTLTLALEGSTGSDNQSTASELRQKFIKDAALEQMKKVETKYLSRLSAGESWVRELRVEDEKRNLLFSARRDEWTNYDAKNSNR